MSAYEIQSLLKKDQQKGIVWVITFLPLPPVQYGSIKMNSLFMPRAITEEKNYYLRRLKLHEITDRWNDINPCAMY